MSYVQPNEYHFSLDSVQLAQRVAQYFLQKPNSVSLLKNVLDLCAGTGVIGIEFLHIFPQIENLHFIEVQSEYETYYLQNKSIFLSKSISENLNAVKTQWHWHNMNYNDIHPVVNGQDVHPVMSYQSTQSMNINLPKERLPSKENFPLEAMDLILSNPPYFKLGQGKMSPSELKNRSRFFIDSNFETFCQVLPLLLKPNGEAHLVFRPLSEHKWDLIKDLQWELRPYGHVDVIGEIRTAKWVRFIKK